KHGGNRKRRLNDMLQMAGIGGFRGMMIRNAARNGAHIILVDAKNTSNECTICEFVSKESRVSRDSFICINCGDESHADLNAACVILKRGIIQCPVDRAEGQAVLRRRATRGRPGRGRGG
ncbi:MAG: transposase, partial [Nitrosopumilaceae archaeon]|nr:transposase [Nitrosopumilaceae archaeon]